MEHLLELEGVTLVELKSVSGRGVAGNVADVSFRLPNGKIYGAWASPREDASLLLALMSGARTLSGGSVLINGLNLQKEAAQARKCIGYFFADLLPDDNLTPLEYLMLVADMRALPYEKTVRYAHELLEMIDLLEKKDHLIENLTRGEQRLLCLAQLLLGNPEILFLDRPLADMTPRDVQKICALIKHLKATKTIFLCTSSAHDLTELCDEILVLENGALKSIIPANSEALAVLTAVPDTATVDSPVEDETPPKTSNRWQLLTQRSDAYEVIDDGKEET